MTLKGCQYIFVKITKKGAGFDRSRTFAHHKAARRGKFSVKKHLSLKRDAPQLAGGVGDFDGAEGLQNAADGGGVGDDKGGPAVRQSGEDLLKAAGHPGADLAERFAIWILEVRVLILALPE